MKVLGRGISKNILLSALLFSISISAEEAHGLFVCGTPDSATWPFAPPIDTLKAVAVYACRTSAPTIQLPTWAKGIWNSSQQASVPRYFKDNSFGKYLMTAAAYGSGGTPGIVSEPTFRLTLPKRILTFG